MRRVLHAIESLAPTEGGPPRVVAGLAMAQRSLGVDAQILCGDGRLFEQYLQYWEAQPEGFPSDCAHSSGTQCHLLARRRALQSWLGQHVRNFDLVHIHQLWRLVPTETALACQRSCVPYIIAPHTSLSPWALSQKRAKKMLARWLVWNRILRGAAGFHALNDLEAVEIATCVGRDAPPVFVVANGVSPAQFNHTPLGSIPAAFEGRLTRPDGAAPFVLFLARLHIMKGPDILLDAFAGLAQQHPSLQLVFAGPDFGMREGLRRRVVGLPRASRVHFLGMVTGGERLWLLSAAICLSQPSRDEGFSLSILEAMASATPVVISDRCKFPEVERQHSGLIVPPSARELAAALSIYVGDPARRTADGLAARRLIEQRYTWDSISRQTVRMYTQLIERPSARATRRCELQ